MNTFENIMENGAFAPKEQMLHFPQYFQIYDTSKAGSSMMKDYPKVPWAFISDYDISKFQIYPQNISFCLDV